MNTYLLKAKPLGAAATRQRSRPPGRSPGRQARCLNGGPQGPGEPGAAPEAVLVKPPSHAIDKAVCSKRRDATARSGRACKSPTRRARRLPTRPPGESHGGRGSGVGNPKQSKTPTINIIQRRPAGAADGRGSRRRRDPKALTIGALNAKTSADRIRWHAKLLPPAKVARAAHHIGRILSLDPRQPPSLLSNEAQLRLLKLSNPGEAAT